MAEPTTFSGVGLAALFVAALGPTFGPYAVIAWAALAGAMWPLSKRRTKSRTEAALFLLRIVMLASIVTMPLAIWCESRLGVPVPHAVGLAALAVGMVGDDWPAIFRWLVKQAKARFLVAFTGKSE